VADPPELEQVCQWLRTPALMSDLCVRWALAPATAAAEMLPLPLTGLEALLMQALGGLSHDAVCHWLRHGRGPLGADADQLARELLAVKPRSLEGVLADLTQHERLAGAVPYVAQFVSALALLPRRLIQNELPMGGYVYVTTRGHPEQILPSQFALDDLEFLRRFAENELLFFRREEPHNRTREDLAVV